MGSSLLIQNRVKESINNISYNLTTHFVISNINIKILKIVL